MTDALDSLERACRLQEVVGRSSTDHWLAGARTGVELQEGVFEMLVDLHDCSLIAASVAVIGRTEYSHHIPILTPVVSLHHQLMCSCNQGQTVVMIECLGDVLTESVARASWTYPPPTSVVGITP